MHARQSIIRAAVQQLGALATVPPERIRPGRAAPMPVAQAPYLLVYGRSERSAPVTMGGREARLERELLLAVEIVTASEDNDAQVDALALEVEAALAGEPTLGGLAVDLWLSATTLDARAEGETRIGRARLEFTVTYHTVAAAPDRTL